MQGHSKGTSSDCTPAVFIVSSGRTGSTSILHMLNLIPGYDIKGGNMMLWPDVYDMNKVREADFKIYQHSGLYAWHHANGRNETELMCSMKMMLLGELNPSVHARVIGYKAIKWRFDEDLQDLELLMEAFPCAKVILSKRRNIDDQLLSQGEVFGSMDYFATEQANKALRQIQAQVLQVLKENYETSLPNQDTNKLWFQRNRSPEDRQMIRSILRTKDIMQSLAQPDSRTEFEWRGRVYLDGENVLFHVSQRSATGEHYLLSDVRGSHNGWYVDVSLVALGRSTHDILQSCEA
eukprot:s1207_g17.t2